ncbi:MAG: hypothetical protein ACE5FG_12540 [Myxococcota bacterium]
MRVPTKPTPLKLAEALLWAVLGAVACWRVAGLEPNLVEEGLVVHFAQRLVHGEQLYRDMIFFSGPLPFELLAGLFRLFGEELVVGRWAMVGLHALATGLGFSVARRTVSAPWAHALGAFLAAVPILLFSLLSVFWYTTIALYLGVITVYVALRGTRSAGWAFAAGTLVAGVALCKQSLGVVLALGMVPALVGCSPAGRRVAHARAVLLGGATAAALTIGLYALRGTLDDMLRCLVVVPLSLGKSYSTPYLNLWPPGELAPEILANKVLYLPNIFFIAYGIFTQVGSKLVLFTQLLYALPLAALVATGLARLAHSLPPALWLNAALLGAMVANSFPRADWGHLVFALPPALFQVALLAGIPRGSSAGARRAGWGAWLGAGVLAAGVLVGVLWVHQALNALAIPSYWGPRVPLRPVSQIYRTLSVPRVITYLREKTTPGEPIFVARSEPLLYFATDTTNPTPFGGVLPVLHEEQEEKILAALRLVRYVVMSDIDQPIFTYYSEELPGVQAYLERYYRVPQDFRIDDRSWIIVVERGPDRGPTAIDLLDQASGAQRWIRNIRGVMRPIERQPPRVAGRQIRRPLAVELGPFGGGIDFELELPQRAVFQAGIGMRGMVSLRDFHVHPRGATMIVSIGRDGRFETLAEVPVDDSPGGSRRWTPVEVDLARWGGQRVTLRLEARPESLFGRDTFTWWGSPRIALPPGRP